jgi:hypothetical protein
MRQRAIFLTLVMILLVPTLLGCEEKETYGPA